MDNKALESYLEKLPADKFKSLIAQRRSIIGGTKAELPKYDYNANMVARALHPAVQYVKVSKIIEQPGAKTFCLAPDASRGTKALAYFNAGQYISVKLKIGESVLTRAYSLSGSPKEALDGLYMLTIKRSQDGFASNYILDNWKEGTPLEISAPDGDFGYEPLRDAKHIVALAGGSGITPFFSMAKSVADGTDDYSLTLLYGCRFEKDILFNVELNALAQSCDKLKIVYILSDEEKPGFEHGFINADLIRKYAPKCDYSVFVCGPQVMYHFAAKEIEKLSLSRRRVRFDVFGEYHNADRDDKFPKDSVGKTYQLTVELPGGVKKVIPTKSSESILVALERAGIEAPSKCRSGECGFCRSRLRSGSYYIPEGMEYRRAADKKDGYIHPCCSFPTSDISMFVNCDKGEIKREVKDMAKKQRTITLIMTAIMSAAMGAIAAALARKGMNPQALAAAPAAAMFIRNILMSLTVGIIGVFVFPFAKWGRALVRKNNAKPDSLKFSLLNCLPLSAGNCLVISIIVSFVSVAMAHAQIPAQAAPPLMLMWLSSWLKMLPVTFIASYIIAVLLSPVVARVVGMPMGGPPAGAPKK